MEQTNRYQSVDFLKGVAIFLMVMGHYLAGSTSGIEDCGPNAWSLGQFIYSFHMPLLFLLSGYLFGKKKDYHTESFHNLSLSILHKLRTLILPAFTFMIIGYVLFGKFDMAWFLKVLFQMYAVFMLVQYFSRKLHLSLNIELVVHFVVFAIWFVGSHLIKYSWANQHLWLHGAAARYPYLVIGYLFSLRQCDEKLKNKNWIYTIAFIIYVVSFYVSHEIIHGKSASYISSYITAPAASLALFFIGEEVTRTYGNSTIIKLTSLLGRNSLSIYLLSSFFLISTPSIARMWANMNIVSSIILQVVSSVTASLVCVFICLVINYLINYSKILSFICLGKRNS